MTRKYNGFKREATIVTVLFSAMAGGLWAMTRHGDSLASLTALLG